MPQIVTPKRNPTPEYASPELNPTVKQQVADILEDAQPERQTPAPSPKARPAGWGYSVPCAGVRYYSF